jgi:hypothetical protein
MTATHYQFNQAGAITSTQGGKRNWLVMAGTSPAMTELVEMH